jgi:hypothetical protein
MTKDEALNMAIEALEDFSTQYARLEPIINACKEALEQPAQEPVGIIISENDYHAVSFDKRMGRVFWFITFDEYKNGAKLYTHPHRWQGLTANEIASIPLDEHTVQTVEHLLRSKNLCI